MAQLGAALLSSIFSSIQLSGGRNSSPGSNPFPNPFDSEMISRLENLKHVGDSNTHLDLQWLQEALAMVLFAHAYVAQTIPESHKTPLSEKASKSINDYVDDSVKLLDVCNALKESLADVERYQMLVQLALHTLDANESINEKKLLRSKAVLNECMEAMKKKDDELDRHRQHKSRLENCSSMLRRMGERLTTVTWEGSSLLNSMYGAKASAVFVCGVVAAVLMVKPRRPLPSLHMTTANHGPRWAPPLVRLQSRVKDEMEKRKARGSNSGLLRELDCVHSEVVRLHGLLQRVLGEKSFSERERMKEVRESVGLLHKYAEGLRKGMGPLENQIKELYKMLVSTRVALLGVLSHVRS